MPVERKTSSRMVLFFYWVLWTAPAWAQSTAEIRGRIQDDSHHPVVSAFVILTAQDTSVMRAASSNEQGEFAFPALPVGTYGLQVSADGFVSFNAKDIRASMGAVATLEIVLGATDKKKVSVATGSGTSLVETGNAQLGMVISQ